MSAGPGAGAGGRRGHAHTLCPRRADALQARAHGHAPREHHRGLRGHHLLPVQSAQRREARGAVAEARGARHRGPLQCHHRRGRPEVRGAAHGRRVVPAGRLLPQQAAGDARAAGRRGHVHMPGRQHHGLQLPQRLPHRAPRWAPAPAPAPRGAAPRPASCRRPPTPSPPFSPADPKPPGPPVAPSSSATSLPWPVVIGIPAGAVFILGTVLLWLCQAKKKPCSPAPGPPVPAHRTPAAARDRGGDKDLPVPPALSGTTGVGLCEELGAPAAPQHLLGPGSAVGPKLYPKLYTDVHTHTHTHVEGKVHQHQHVHYQC